MKLSPSQKKIVSASDGNILVTATAGSGKTRVLTERIRHLLAKNPLDGVLALTFTNKASEEMTTRLNDIKDLRHRSFIGTIHSFALEIIEKHGHHIGLESIPHVFERDEDRMRLLEESLVKCGIELAETDSKGNDIRKKQLFAWLERISLAKRKLLSDQEIESEYPDEDFHSIYREYNKTLRAHGGTDFDDLLIFAHRIITEAPNVKKIYNRAYSHICVDEAQDLNFAQYELISTLCRNSNVTLMMVGDPDQSIYGFNGSSPSFMTHKFATEFAPTRFILTENFRSSKEILYLAELLKPGSQLTKKTEKTYYAGRVLFQEASDEEFEAHWVVLQISNLLKESECEEIEGEITLEKMVVLGRNRFVFQALEKLLKRDNYEYYFKKSPGPPIFESQSVQIFDLLLRIVINLHDRLHSRQLASLCNLPWTDDTDALTFLNKIHSEKCHIDSVPAQFASLFLHELEKQQNLREADLPASIEQFIEAIQNATIDDDEKERAIVEFSDLNVHWQRYVRGISSNSNLSLSGFRSALAMGKTQPEMVPKGLALSTVHTMKGLEYDIVFLMGMGQGCFPDYRAKSKSALEEERNNAFVAITRAKRFLYISYPKMKMMPWGGKRIQDPSQFLGEMGLL
ncbi:MAG: ATP-dependent helicase [Candidatus Wallbacteria bacterium]|nr:ATP-dependent helicase [Candidatus Wallbacteria bacterium]